MLIDLAQGCRRCGNVLSVRLVIFCVFKYFDSSFLKLILSDVKDFIKKKPLGMFSGQLTIFRCTFSKTVDYSDLLSACLNTIFSDPRDHRDTRFSLL